MRSIALVLTCLVVSLHAGACDACGCGISGDSWGITPFSSHNYFGVRFQYRHFFNEHPSIFEGNHPLTGDDHFHRYELVFKYNLSRRFQVMAQMPYRTNIRNEAGMDDVNTGPGDAAINLQYLPVLPGKGEWKHALQVSVGMEAPTGKFNRNTDSPAIMQTGSGSWDVLAGISYVLRNGHSGIGLDHAFRLNGETADGYDWGNGTVTSLRYMYAVELDDHRKIVPWISGNLESFQQDFEGTGQFVPVDYSGGSLWTGTVGFDYLTDWCSLGLETAIPIHNHLSGGFTQLKAGAGARLLVFINRNGADTPLAPAEFK